MHDLQFKLPLVAFLLLISFVVSLKAVSAQSISSGRQISGKVRGDEQDVVIPGKVVAPNVATAGQLVISEFRVRGPNGLNDEFIEIFNNSGSDHTVSALSGSGYGVAASDGTTRFVRPRTA